MKNEISILYEDIYKKRFDSLTRKFDDSTNNGIVLDKIKSDITDAYAKGKISEQHYTLLNKKISDYENNHESIYKKLSSQKIVTTSTTDGSPIKTEK